MPNALTTPVSEYRNKLQCDKMGTFHLLGGLRAGEPVTVAEGYATGATVHRATGMAVAVAVALRDQDPARPIYMAADNDHHLPVRARPLPNAGREKAEAAALAVGATVLLPEPVPDRWRRARARTGTTTRPATAAPRHGRRCGRPGCRSWRHRTHG